MPDATPKRELARINPDLERRTETIITLWRTRTQRLRAYLISTGMTSEQVRNIEDNPQWSCFPRE